MNYPVMKFSSETSGPPITPAAFEASMKRMRDPEVIRQRHEVEEAQRKAAIEYIERRYANYLGVVSLSPKQREDLYDGLAEAWWRRVEDAL